MISHCYLEKNPLLFSFALSSAFSSASRKLPLGGLYHSEKKTSTIEKQVALIVDGERREEETN